MKQTSILFIGETYSPVCKILQAIEDIELQVVQQMMQVSHRLSDFEVMIADLSETSSKRHVDRIRLQAPDLPLIVVVDRSQAAMVAALSDRVEDYLLADEATETLIRHSIRYAQERARLTESAQLTQEHLERVIDDQKILRRIERELGYTLNIDRVLGLAMDTATRLTAASACAIGWIEEDARRIIRLATLGTNHRLAELMLLDELAGHSQIEAVLESSKPEVVTDGRYSHVMLPLIVRGRTSGILSLEGIPEGFYYDQSDWEFLIHLSNRTASAIHTARSHERTLYQAEKLNLLYELSNTITLHLDRDDLMDASVAALCRLLDAQGAMYFDFHPQTRTLSATQQYIPDGSHEAAIKSGDVIEMFDFSLLLAMMRISMFQIRRHDPAISDEDRVFIQLLGVESVLLAPLIAEDGRLKGVLVVYQQDPEHVFNNDEIALARSFVNSVSVALRKAELFADVQQLEQIKSEMIHMVSHDLRTPLSRILLSVRVMEQRGKFNEPEHKDFVNGITETTRLMQNLLEDILSLEQIESQDKHGWKHFDAVEMMQRVADTFTEHARLHQQHYAVELPRERITVLGNEIQIQQAFSNYISNAVKYTPSGGTVTVRAHTEGGFLVFEVQDTGFGIAPESHDRIFERFYRAKTPGTETISGTGLGLSLVRTVIERHGGRVWFTSEPGVGSTFSCSVPYKEA